MHLRPDTPSAPLGGIRMRWSLLLLLSIAQLMVILDISAVNVALPDLASDLNIAHADIGWTITSYSLIFGSLLLLGGRAADLLGRRRLFLTGLGVFTTSSLLSATAGSAAALFAARAGQGLGASMLSPAALSIMIRALWSISSRAIASTSGFAANANSTAPKPAITSIRRLNFARSPIGAPFSTANA